MNIVLLIPPNKNGYIRDTYYGCWHKKKFIDYNWPPIYMYQLSAIIQNSQVIDLSLKNKNYIEADIVICNIGTYTFNEDQNFLKKIKNQSKIIAFGQHPTISPKEVLKSGVVDIVIRGEPEEVIIDVIKNINDDLKLKKIKGVCFNNHISKDKAFVADIDSLPISKRPNSNNDYFNPLIKKSTYTTMLATRGCPFDCTFCTVPILYGKTFRKRSVNNVILEITKIKDQGYDEIFFRDENFTLHKKYLKNICEKIIENKLNVSWICNSRVDTIDLELLNIMKKAGCHLIKFGVESSNQNTLDSLKKGVTVERIIKTIAICKKVGIETMGHFMIGLPGENEEEIFKTISFSKALDPTYASYDVLINYPDTTIGKSFLSKNELEKLHNLAFRRFYLRPKMIFKHILSIKSIPELLNKIRASIQLWINIIKKK